MIVVGVYVDENLLLYSEGALWDEFIAAWSDFFDEHENAALTSDDFCGIHLTTLPDGGVALDAPKLMNRLRAALFAQPDNMPPNLHFATPVAADAHLRMKEPPSASNPILDDAHIAAARVITGLIGWLCSTTRLDGLLGFVMVSQFAGARLTKHVWRGLMRLGHYLVSTSHICLCFHPSPTGDPTENFVASVDSSCLNGPVPGSSYGGLALQYAGSGAFAVKCLSPRKLTDSTGGAELIMACLLAKQIIAFRMFLCELGLTQRGPTVTTTDSNVVMQGAEMERVSNTSRWLAARLAITRQTIYDGLMSFRKSASADLVADIMTKGIAKPAHFVLLRDMLMGTRDGTATGTVNTVADGAPSLPPIPHIHARTAAYRSLKLIAGLVKDHLTRASRGECRHDPTPHAPGQASAFDGTKALVAHFAQAAHDLRPGWRRRLWSDASARATKLRSAYNVAAKPLHRDQDLRRAARWLERHTMAAEDHDAL